MLEAMQNPEIVAILQDAEVQAVLRQVSGGGGELPAAMRRPDMVSKLRKLSAAGLINMAWQP